MGMRERFNEAYEKQSARRADGLDYTSFFEGYSAGLTERDIVLDKLAKAKMIIGNLYAICKDNHYLDSSVIMEQAEQFLIEVSE